MHPLEFNFSCNICFRMADDSTEIKDAVEINSAVTKEPKDVVAKRKSGQEFLVPAKKVKESTEIGGKASSNKRISPSKKVRHSKKKCNELINTDHKRSCESDTKTTPEVEENRKNESKSVDDEFSPSVDMMIEDYDDERTLDEEEALGQLEDPQTELSTLQKEGDMPLADLMAKYGIQENTDKYESSEEDSRSGTEETEEKPEPSELEQLYEDVPIRNTSRISIRPSRYASRQESEDEEDSPEEEEKKKTIMVGSDYQAVIPEGLCKYDDSLPYENEDKLVWDPVSMSAKEIEEYLLKAQEPILNDAQSVASIPRGAHTRDDEQSLFLLLQCGYNVEEALRRRRLNAVPPPESMSLWSEEECRNFENGLRLLGKDFRQIQQNKVKTRSVGEIVQFYYLWKKTERHDIFANKARLEKKKYSLHPGITDYMDRFLEEQDGPSSRDRSLSPGTHNCTAGPENSNAASTDAAAEKVPKNETQAESSKVAEKSDKKSTQSNDKILLNPKKSNDQLHPQ